MTTADYLPSLLPPDRLALSTPPPPTESTAIYITNEIGRKYSLGASSSDDDESRPLLSSPSRHEARSDNTGKRRAAEGNYKDFRPQRGFDCCSSGCQRAFVEFLTMWRVLV